jgi:hypothetical protein
LAFILQRKPPKKKIKIKAKRHENKGKTTNHHIHSNSNNVCISSIASNSLFIENFDNKITAIIKYIERFYNTTFEELLIKNRFNELVEPRQMIMYVCIAHYKISNEAQMARKFDRDRSTAYHSVIKIQNTIDTEPAFKKKFDKIVDELDKVLYLLDMNFNNFSL